MITAHLASFTEGWGVFNGKVLGAVLAQKQADGFVHPVAYASRSLNPHEKNYAISELETLALVGQ